MKTACLQVLINRIHYSLAGGGHMMNRTVTPASPCIHCTYDISSCLASRGSMSHLLLALVCHWSRLPDGKHHWLPRMFVTVCIIKLCVSLLRMFVTLCDLLLAVNHLPRMSSVYTSHLHSGWCKPGQSERQNAAPLHHPTKTHNTLASLPSKQT